MNDIKHGQTAYSHYGCKCEICTEANTKRVYRRRHERKPEDYTGEHGKQSAYINWGCRCVDCSAAHAAMCKKQYEERKARGLKK